MSIAGTSSGWRASPRCSSPSSGLRDLSGMRDDALLARSWDYGVGLMRLTSRHVRTAAYFLAVPLALVAVTPLGWWLAFSGGAALVASDSTEARLEAALLLAVALPFVIIWLLKTRRDRAASAALMVHALTWVAVAWDRHRDKFVEYGLVIALLSVVIGFLLLTTSGRNAPPS